VGGCTKENVGFDREGCDHSSTIFRASKNPTLYVCMYVRVKGGPIRLLHRDPQWSIVLPLSLVILSAILHFGYSAGFYTWGRRDSHLVP
jgi:hypothetical protein